MKISRRDVMLFRGSDAALNDPDQKTNTYEIHPRKDQHGVNLISDVLPFGRLLYLELCAHFLQARSKFCNLLFQFLNCLVLF